MNNVNLTGKNFWEQYWVEKPGMKKADKINLSTKSLLNTFNENLPDSPGLTILEIGGASGEYLLYLAKRFQYRPYSLDYSHAGNAQTLKTFSEAGMEVTVYERDLFADNGDLPKFDIVFSLGFIEHFDDPIQVVARHLDFVKPGGILMLGVPNYAGIYRPVLRRLAPSIEQTHNMQTMDLHRWTAFAEKLDLRTKFQEYIGGFEPLNMKKLEVPNLLNKTIYFFIRVLMVLFSFRMQFLRKFNSASWSGYMLGIYRKAG